MVDIARRKLRKLLEEPVLSKRKSSAERKVKDYYFSCLYGREETKTVQYLWKMLKKVGGWKHHRHTIGK